MARIVAEKMSKTLGQQIVVENRAGAGGSIATRQVAKAAPDGYTLVIGGTGTLAVNPTLYDNVGYDPRKDFAPVGLIGTSQLIVAGATPASPAQDHPGADRARQEGSRQAQLCLGRRRQRHPSRRRAVSSYDGRRQAHPRALPAAPAPALTDLIGGHVSDLFLVDAARRSASCKDGKVRALAVTGPKRSPIFPDLPTVAEAALPGLRGGAALRHRRAGRHAEADHRQAQRGAARGGRCRPTPRSAWPPTAPSRSPRRPRNTPPTSTRKRPSGPRS